jgi:DNA-binding CsgD family transcriptional regulator
MEKQAKTEKELLQLQKTFFWQLEKNLMSNDKEYLDKLFYTLPGDCMHINDPATVSLTYLDPVARNKYGMTHEMLQTKGLEMMVKGIEPKNFEKNMQLAMEYLKRDNPYEIGVLFQKMVIDPAELPNYEWFVSFMKRSDKASGLFTLDFRVSRMEPYSHKFMKLIELDEFVHKNMETFQALGAREIEVLTKVGLGHSSEEIANEMSISKLTVDTHRKNIMHKLDVKSFPELIKFAEAFDLI